jgi:tripartite-type tricarboxylate transporter receptor subunit TctC
MRKELAMKRILTSAILAFGMLAAGLVSAQQYPSKPIRIIAPFSPGGGTDFIARFIAQKLTERLGQSVIVDNRPGAGGNLGAELAVKAAPDGYTLLLVAGSYTVNPSLYKLSFDSANDITPIVQLSQGPFVVAVHPSIPVKTLQELIEYAKKNPDKLAYGTSGSGSITHLASELFLDMAKIKMVHVPYKGTGPALNDAIAGTVQVLFGSVATTLQHIKSGRLRGLAVTTSKRIAAAPELPTVAEAGVPGYEVTLWHGLVGPMGIPRPIVDRLNNEVGQALKGKETGEHLAADGVTPAGGTPEQFQALIKSDIERWRKVVQRAGVKVE